jgi:hypothetical protein
VTKVLLFGVPDVGELCCEETMGLCGIVGEPCVTTFGAEGGSLEEFRSDPAKTDESKVRKFSSWLMNIIRDHMLETS